MTFAQQLVTLNACNEAREWVGARDLATAWSECQRGDWMLWLAARAGVDRRVLVLACCDVAEPALVHVPPGEDRPRLAIETARAWCRGEATIERVRDAAYDAAYAADAAYDAAYDAYDAATYAADAAYAAAADAAYAAYAAAYAAAADAAAYSAASAAYVADAAHVADDAAARRESLARSADIVRARITAEMVAAAAGRTP